MSDIPDDPWPPMDDAESHYVLRLYVTGSTPRSTKAIENIRKICDTHLKDRFELEVVDIYQNPAAAREGQVIAAPTLVKLLPEPLRRVIGDLSDHERVLAGLSIVAVPPSTDRDG